MACLCRSKATLDYMPTNARNFLIEVGASLQEYPKWGVYHIGAPEISSGQGFFVGNLGAVSTHTVDPITKAHFCFLHGSHTGAFYVLRFLDAHKKEISRKQTGAEGSIELNFYRKRCIGSVSRTIQILLGGPYDGIILQNPSVEDPFAALPLPQNGDKIESIGKQFVIEPLF